MSRSRLTSVAILEIWTMAKRQVLSGVVCAWCCYPWNLNYGKAATINSMRQACVAILEIWTMAKLRVLLPVVAVVLLSLKSELWQSKQNHTVTSATVLLSLKSELWQSSQGQIASLTSMCCYPWNLNYGKAGRSLPILASSVAILEIWTMAKLLGVITWFGMSVAILEIWTMAKLRLLTAYALRVLLSLKSELWQSR